MAAGSTVTEGQAARRLDRAPGAPRGVGMSFSLAALAPPAPQEDVGRAGRAQLILSVTLAQRDSEEPR